MEADNRKKALEAKLERYRLKLSQYQAEMGGDRADVPSTHPGEYDIAHGTQPSQPSQRGAAVKATPSQRSTGVQRTTPQHELVVEASPVPGPALAAPPPLTGPKEAVTPRIPTPPVTAPPQLPPPAPVGLSDTITPQMQGSGSSSFPSSCSSLLSSEPWAGLGVRVLDALFLRGSSDLRALMQHEGGRCWSVACVNVCVCMCVRSPGPSICVPSFLSPLPFDVQW